MIVSNTTSEAEIQNIPEFTLLKIYLYEGREKSETLGVNLTYIRQMCSKAYFRQLTNKMGQTWLPPLIVCVHSFLEPLLTFSIWQNDFSVLA